jgi:hypothetical protein
MSLQKVNTGNDIEEALVRISREGYALREAELNVKQLLRTLKVSDDKEYTDPASKRKL